MVAHPPPAPLTAPLTAPLKGALAPAVRAALVAVLAALFLNTFVVGAGRIPSASMSPALEPGDRVLVDRMLYAGGGSRWLDWLPVREPAPGDVLWLDAPGRPERALVKRCAAVPGDRFAGERVAAGRLAVLGDNRADSLDSRRFGTVARESVRGRVVLVLWSKAPGGAVRWNRVARPVR